MQLDARKAGVREHLPQAAASVIEDRAVVDHLVAKLADRPLRPRPARKARDDRAGAQLADSTYVRVGVLDVVEVTEREDDVEGTGERRREEVALYELGLAVEPCHALLLRLRVPKPRDLPISRTAKKRRL